MINIICIKWGTKYNHKFVNRLYFMVKKNFKKEFNFICYTENSENINSDIIIKDLNSEYELETVWWKLSLFENKTEDINIFFDLDIVIQKDITHLLNYVQNNKLTTIKAYWKPHMHNMEENKFLEYDMDLNSSIMIWQGDLSYIWNKFYDNMDLYMMKYNGIDSFLYFNIKTICYLPEKIVYSRLYGIDSNNYWNTKKGPPEQYLYYTKDYDICIFNGYKNKRWYRKFKREEMPYMLDEESYNGFEKYWN